MTEEVSSHRPAKKKYWASRALIATDSTNLRDNTHHRLVPGPFETDDDDANQSERRCLALGGDVTGRRSREEEKGMGRCVACMLVRGRVARAVCVCV